MADFIGEMNFFHATVKDVTEANVTVNAGLLSIVTLPRGNVPASVGAGDHILLAIRPEHIRLASQGVAGEHRHIDLPGRTQPFHVKIAGRTEPVAVEWASAVQAMR